MNCFFCATPYHIIASITLATGKFAGEESMLVVLNHFDIDEAMVQRIRSTGVFKEVLLYNSNNKSNWSKAKRLANVFVPDHVMNRLANQMSFSHCVFFALDFLNLAYMIKRYQKRGVDCEFAFGDDGIGAYLNVSCYHPKPLVVNLLKLTNRLTALESVKKLLVYKPELMVENTEFVLEKIPQSPEIYAKLQQAVAKIFVMESDIDVTNAVLYFEQPVDSAASKENAAEEQRLLKLAMEKKNLKAVVKMHPRSTCEALWNQFPIMKTKIPFEAMVLQKNYAPAVMMSNCSTAMFSVYLLDNLPVGKCPSIFLNRLIPHQNERFNKAMERYFHLLNSSDEEANLYSPSSEEEFTALLEKLIS